MITSTLINKRASIQGSAPKPRPGNSNTDDAEEDETIKSAGGRRHD